MSSIKYRLHIWFLQLLVVGLFFLQQVLELIIDLIKLIIVLIMLILFIIFGTLMNEVQQRSWIGVVASLVEQK